MSTAHDTVTLRNTCRACLSAPVLEPLLDLGATALSAFPTSATAPAEFPPVPLALMVCPRCTLVQLRHTTPFHWLFGREYWYRSGVNETMRAELAHVVEDAITRVGGLHFDDTVLDIGANDGTLLGHYGRRAVRMAFEPSTSMEQALRPHAEILFADAFPPQAPMVAHDLAAHYGRVKIITAIAMAYALEDPHAFFAEIAALLAPDGVLVIQFQDLLQMVEATAFDNICHEHLEYYTLYSLATLLNQHRLDVVDVERRAINGGSLRAIVMHRGTGTIPSQRRAGTERVLAQIKREHAVGLNTSDIHAVFGRFRRRIGVVERQVLGTLAYVLAQGGTIDLLGASTKGNTLLQVLGLHHGHIRQAIERSPEKWGRYVGQTGIPIVSEERGRQDPANVWLCPLWQFREALLTREAGYLADGGSILFPLPAFEVVVPGIAVA